ncbi:MAG: NADH-quinone oxidoreductase subunit A [Verrucomicrobia bacterium]|nr:NADH-quinone oxidoreductase subunit A [Verrucomicrobiota bacterium]MCF7708041.1 NADH-quinone oxidoreductase subunit A [Verrucomicrobiota bacterium]
MILGTIDSQLIQYIPVLLLLIAATGIVAGMLVFSVILGKSGKRDQIKDTPYECGMIPETSEIPRFSVKFYLVALLFILFDIEVIFLFPWAVVYRDKLDAGAGMILGSMTTFLVLLFIGYIYALKKGALRWYK